MRRQRFMKLALFTTGPYASLNVLHKSVNSIPISVLQVFKVWIFDPGEILPFGSLAIHQIIVSIFIYWIVFCCSKFFLQNIWMFVGYPIIHIWMNRLNYCRIRTFVTFEMFYLIKIDVIVGSNMIVSLPAKKFAHSPTMYLDISEQFVNSFLNF